MTTASVSLPAPSLLSESERTVRIGWGVVLALLLFAGCAVAGIDLRLSRLLVHEQILRPWTPRLELFETWGDASGVAFVAMVVALFDRSPGRRWLFPLATGWGAGLVADIPKLLIARVRPRSLDFDTTSHAWETFRGWLVGLEHGSKLQSFPSAHTASAFGLAVALALLYPRGKPVFLGLAVLVAFQRINTGAHYLSDTCCGAAIGTATALVIWRFGAGFAVDAESAHEVG